MKFFPGTTNLFDDMLDDMFTSPFFSNRSDMVMKTDITEKDGYYTLDMELPGCKKEDIHLELKDGYIAVNRDMATNIPGVFAAGDCTGQPLQIAKAAGEGQVAGHRAAEYLDRLDRAQNG